MKVYNPCQICNYWTPEKGCAHYKADHSSALLSQGFTIAIRPGKVTCVRNGEIHRFPSMEKAFQALIERTSNPKQNLKTLR